MYKSGFERFVQSYTLFKQLYFTYCLIYVSNLPVSVFLDYVKSLT